MKNHQILKLSSGEEIICNLLGDEHPRTYEIESPLKVNAVPRMTRTGVEEAISLQRWVHFSEGETYAINKSSVMIITKASAGLSKFYEHCIVKMRLEHSDVGEDVRDLDPTDEELDDIEQDERWDRFGDPDSKLIH
jgi:hypothetical protein